MIPPDGGGLRDLVPAAREQLHALYDGLWEGGVDPATLELCRIRIATLIGSAADVDAREPRAGADEALIEQLPAWPTAATFTDAHRAALGFAEQFTLDAHGVTDAQTADLHHHFSPAQLATLTTAIAVFDALARVHAIAGHLT